MRLIREQIDTANIVTEEKEGKKNTYIEGIFMQAEIKNRNGRLYPRGVMEGAVTRYIEEKVNNRTAYGELAHPSGPNINPDRVSHLIESLTWNGNDVTGRAKIGGPMGDHVHKLMELGGQIGVSSRGLGSLKTNKMGIMEVQNDFRLATAADIVLDPSAPSAFVKGVMENKEYFYDVARNVWVEHALVEIEETLDKSRNLDEQIATRLFKNLMSALKEGTSIVDSYSDRLKKSIGKDDIGFWHVHSILSGTRNISHAEASQIAEKVTGSKPQKLTKRGALKWIANHHHQLKK